MIFEAHTLCLELDDGESWEASRATVLLFSSIASIDTSIIDLNHAIFLVGHFFHWT
jgi:hypothetical protein